jgi:hypothetical protein
MKRKTFLVAALVAAGLILAGAKAFAAPDLSSESPGTRPPTTITSEQPGIRPPSINLNNCVVTFESRGMYYFVNRYQGGSIVESFNSTDYTIAHNKYDLWIKQYGCSGIES